MTGNRAKKLTKEQKITIPRGAKKNDLFPLEVSLEDFVKNLELPADLDMPLAEYQKYVYDSIHNPATESNAMMLGKFADGGETSYIGKAKTEPQSTYFDMGDDFNKLRDEKCNGDNAKMFEYFNKPALDFATDNKKTIKFSHDPEVDKGALGEEWKYLTKEKGYIYDADSMTAYPPINN